MLSVEDVGKVVRDVGAELAKRGEVLDYRLVKNEAC